MFKKLIFRGSLDDLNAALDAVQYLVDRIRRDLPVEGPLSLDIGRVGQQIVDTAYRSAQEKRTLKLEG